MGEHENVLGILHVSVDINDMPLVVLPYMSNGSLYDFLKDTDRTEPPLTYSLCLRFARDASRGMEYLSAKHIIHRDLAARNCLLDNDLTLKICDFGLSREHADSFGQFRLDSEVEYIIQTTDLALPLRWTALEALMSSRFSIETDIWSLGVLVWEILTRATRPYDDLKNEEVMGYLNRGYRLCRPSYWRDTEVWLFIVECWNVNPQHRPSFIKLYEFFKIKHSQYAKYEAEHQPVSKELVVPFTFKFLRSHIFTYEAKNRKQKLAQFSVSSIQKLLQLHSTQSVLDGINPNRRSKSDPRP